jgi:hypothetical protein
MQPPQSLKIGIIAALDALPDESLQEVSEFVAFLQARLPPPKRPKPVIQLGGLWSGTPAITAADIAEARHEMWGNLGEPEQ